jgi:hypothetical protein
MEAGMEIKRLPRTGDGIHLVITADDGSKHRMVAFEDHGDDGAKGIAMAVDAVKQRVARAHQGDAA